MSAYWPWWAGAAGLGGITVGYYAALGRTIGISGAWERVIHWREERATERLDAALDDDALTAALEAATRAAFGGSDGSGTAQGAVAAPPVPRVVDAKPSAPPPTRTPVAAQATLLASVFLGGLLAALVSGRFKVRTDMGEAFSQIVAHGNAMWPVLFIGGILVGFGTRLAGGCSSGHGLSGCSRFQPASIVATATFFGTAVVVSTLLWKVI